MKTFYYHGCIKENLLSSDLELEGPGPSSFLDASFARLEDRIFSFIQLDINFVL